MAYLRDQGYPVPAVEEVSADGSALVMERIDGVSMVDAIARRPWSLRRQGRTLAELHARLHALDAPDFLPRAPVGAGERIVHLDLHPLNVMISATGPVVIDWTGAALGDPAVDVAVAWVLTATGEIPGNRLVATAMGWGRSSWCGSFLSRFDRDEITSVLREVVGWKVLDPHMSPDEIAGMWRLVERAGG